jgi:hypothetical protein
MEISKTNNFDFTTIAFNGIPHLVFMRKELIGLQSWKSGTVYTIELTFRSGATITAEYDEEGKWTEVLRLIEAGGK